MIQHYYNVLTILMYTKILLSTYYSTIDSILKISSLSHVARLHWIGGLLYIIIIYKMLKSKLQNINQTMNRKKVIKNINVEVFVKRNLSHSLLIVLTRSVEMRDSITSSIQFLQLFYMSRCSVYLL